MQIFSHQLPPGWLKTWIWRCSSLHASSGSLTRYTGERSRICVHPTCSTLYNALKTRQHSKFQHSSITQVAHISLTETDYFESDARLTSLLIFSSLQLNLWGSDFEFQKHVRKPKFKFQKKFEGPTLNSKPWSKVRIWISSTCSKVRLWTSKTLPGPNLNFEKKTLMSKCEFLNTVRRSIFKLRGPKHFVSRARLKDILIYSWKAKV